MRRIKALLAVVTLLMPATALSSAPASAAKTYAACVNKTSGKTVLARKGKCKKGWKKITWTKQGATGSQGPQGGTGPRGSLGQVYDGNGVRVGEFLGYYGQSYVGFFLVRIDGADWPFLSNGWLYMDGADISYDNAACAGNPFLSADDEVERNAVLGTPSTRYVFRTTGGGVAIGTPSAYAVVGTSQAVVALNRWYRNSNDGTCTAGSALTGFRVPLTAVPAPADLKGPLSVRLG